jgi:hypothetical protein
MAKDKEDEKEDEVIPYVKMGRPFKLNNLEEIQAVVCEYKKDNQPTFVGLCRALNISPPTLYSSMDKNDDIADALKDAWTWLIYCWERQLWKSKNISAIFYLKTIRRFDFQWRDTPPPEVQSPVDINSIDNKLTIEVITKNAKDTIITSAE